MMDTSSSDEDGDSGERLLGDADKDVTAAIGENEEESIQLLIEALEDSERAQEERRELKRSGGTIALASGNPETYFEESTDGSERGLIQQKPAIPKTDGFPLQKGSSGGKRRQLADLRRAMHQSERRKVFCGIVVILFMICLCAGLLFLGWFFEIEDLYIIGGIFGLGGIIFTIAFIVVRCQTHEQIKDTDCSVLYRT